MSFVPESTSKQASKQAILIIAHEVNSAFTSLIQMLDHKKIDIFIHMDAKNKSYNPAETLKLVKSGRIFHTKRIKVSWGGYSQIEAELILLEAASSQEHYEHYHLISGADLPIKTREEIIDFFERHHGIEFLNFQSSKFLFYDRVRYYYPFQEIAGRKSSIIIRIASKLCLILQKFMHVHRNKNIKFQKGTNWFSITDELARYVISKREWILKVFHNTKCCDEVFLHTLIVNSTFIDNIFCKDFNNDHLSAMRLIDWKRGSPYTFRSTDIDEIKASEAMFARKFHPSVDAEIIEKIRELYS